MKRFFIPIVVVLGVVVFQSVFIVQEINQAIVLQFGDPKKIITNSGLNFKLPFIQNVAYLDKRVLNLDNPPEEVIAADQRAIFFSVASKLLTRTRSDRVAITDASSRRGATTRPSYSTPSSSGARP